MSRRHVDPVQERSAALVRAGGTLVTIPSPPEVRPRDGRAIGPLVEAPAAFAPGRHAPGKPIIRVTDGG